MMHRRRDSVKRSIFPRPLSRALFALLLLALPLMPARAAQSDINGPAGSGDFGHYVAVLPNGNIVVADSTYDDGPLTDVGAVYLYDGATLAPVSVLKGGAANDRVGSGRITVLANGNFVVQSANWNNGAAQGAGAVTFCSATAGCNGVVSAANSLVGSSTGDAVGSVTALPNGNYVVTSSEWDAYTPVLKSNAGAVTFCKGAAGCSGPVSATNSLIGSAPHDLMGSSQTVLLNGNYIVRAESWSNGATPDAGAVTFGDGTKGTVGPVTSSNSVLGTAAHGGGVVSFVHDPVRNRYVGRRVKNVVTVVSFETTAVADGDLDDAPTWPNGVTDALTNAVIPAGRTVTLNDPAPSAASPWPAARVSS